MFYERADAQAPWVLNKAESTVHNGSTYPAGKLPADFWNDNRKPAADEPYNSDTQKLSAPQDLGDGTVGRVAENLTQTEIDALLDSRRTAAVTRICVRAKELIEFEMNPLGGFRIKELKDLGKTRATETYQWVDDKYMLVETRKAEVLAGLWDSDLPGAEDLSFIGEKPWTIAEILAE